MADEFWKSARKRLVHWATVAIDLAGYDISPFSVLELVNAAPLTPEEVDGKAFKDSYLFTCLQQAQRRLDAGNLPAGAAMTFEHCSRFWLIEYPSMSPVTRSCLLFEVRARIEPVVYGDSYGVLIDKAYPHDARPTDDWDFL